MSDLRGSDGLPIRDSGIWAKEKLYYLERYLDIFSVGMQQKWRGKIYLLFATKDPRGNDFWRKDWLDRSAWAT